MPKLLFLISMFLAPSLALGQQHQSELNSALFQRSIGIPKIAKVCSNRIPGFASRYEPVFSAWLKSNQQRITEGEKIFRSEIEKSNLPFQESIDRATDMGAQGYEQSTQAALEENCNAMLEKLRTNWGLTGG